MKREWFCRIAFMVAGALIAYAGIFLGSIKGCCIVSRHGEDTVRSYYVPTTNAVAVSNGGMATYTSTISVTNDGVDDTVNKIHETLSDSMANWLTVFGFFLTVFGFLVPIGAYLLQIKSIRGECELIVSEAKKECGRLLTAKLSELQKEAERNQTDIHATFDSLWSEIENRIYWQIGQTLLHLRKSTKSGGESVSQQFELWMFTLILVSEMIACDMKLQKPKCIGWIIDFVFGQVVDVWKLYEQGKQEKIKEAIQKCEFSPRINLDEFGSKFGEGHKDSVVQFFLRFGITIK